ncbi:MAG: oxygen-dependent coproporphyrinogen oxidase [Planctomycetota bacterium]
MSDTRHDRRQLVADGFRALQDAICARLEALDGKATFHEDAWQHTHGGGGRTRVIGDGAVFEKGGVNFSAVEGAELPPSIAEKQPAAAGHPFFATGISLVIHPRNPHVPTVHMNCRYFEAGPVWWFGGGSDLTPCYPVEEDVVHFHRTLKAACDATDPAWHAEFKKWCDEYFHIKHRKEQRGVGGIFFDYLGAERGDFSRLHAFAAATGRAFLDAYAPIVERRKDDAWTDAERWFQQVRRGRYVEFNLVYDRGTLFGLQTGGRIESILMSLPPEVRWVYDYQPEPGSREAELTTKWLQPRDWV